MIFKNLSASQRRNKMIVSERWLNLVNNFFSKDNQIVLTGNLNYSRNGQLYRTFSNRLRTTKEKRSFPHLLIKEFPCEGKRLEEFSHFLDLIGEEIQFLVIEDLQIDVVIEMRDNFFNDMIYAKLPNLKSLEVSYDELLGDLTFP